MSDAEAWAGADMLVAEGERAVPEAGEYSHADLIGCQVLDCSSKGGEQPIGVVTGVSGFRQRAVAGGGSRRRARSSGPLRAGDLQWDRRGGEDHPGGIAGRTAGFMIFHVLTIFPEFFPRPFDHGVIQRAREAGLIEIRVHDLRIGRGTGIRPWMTGRSAVEKECC